MTNKDGEFIQQITWENYKIFLNERLREQFRVMAARNRALYNPIVFVRGVLRWANADES